MARMSKTVKSKIDKYKSKKKPNQKASSAPRRMTKEKRKTIREEFNKGYASNYATVTRSEGRGKKPIMRLKPGGGFIKRIRKK